MSTSNSGLPRRDVRTISLLRWIDAASKRLSRTQLHFGHGATSARAEAAWIVANACHLSPRFIHRHFHRALSYSEITRADQIADLRIKTRTPLAYLLKEAWLGNGRFYVDERVIVPRSFIAELLEQKLRPWIAAPERVRTGLDLCAGSACLAILMAKAFPHMTVDAAELSEPAIEVARINIDRFRLKRRVRLIKSDLFSYVSKQARYDVIISNPPYVTGSAMQTLPAEYQKEPRIALSGGKDGLQFIRSIIGTARNFLSSHGLLVLEVGHNKRALEHAFPRLPMVWIETSAGSDMVALIEAADLPSLMRTTG